jgi:predicted dehydrogenase
MQRVKIGIIGAGGVAQIEHVPNLLRLKHQFEIMGVYDPSAAVRNFIATWHGLPTFNSLEALLAESLDAVVIASPDASHHEQILAAFARGLHVFCEKPLCYAISDIDEVIAARDRASKILQVGYMKRFDPSYEAALAHLPGTAKTLRHVSVEVNDSDAWPFIRHHEWSRGEDVPAEMIVAVQVKQKQQVARAMPASLDAVGYRGFTGAYCSALVHDVNTVHGLLDALGVPLGEIVGAQLFAGGDGGQGTVRLMGGQALWTMAHLTAPDLAEYRECITLYFDSSSLELEFPSPYLNHQPTRLTIKRSDGHKLITQDIRTGYEEAFVEELKGFWSAIVEGEPVRNTAEHAHRDMALLSGLAQWHATHNPIGYGKFALASTRLRGPMMMCQSLGVTPLWRFA